jgi:formylglycine-generating enzyme required for sulfatase activity
VSIEQILAAKALGAPVAFENSIGIRFVLIPPGEFMMGSKDPADRVAQLCGQPKMFAGEHPRHKVTLTKAFYMSVHEVTQKHHETITRPKGDKNAWGLYDMHGNLSEWCADAYGPYPNESVSDPKGPTDGTARVVRGGAWHSGPGACRSAFRSGSDGRSYNIGLRVVCSVPTKPNERK